MPRVELAPEIGDDLDRILDHLAEHEVEGTRSRIDTIIQAISVLQDSPLVGRPAEAGMRELIIGRGTRGYVVLYRYMAELDTVFVLAIRGQKEAGYKRP